jgi:histidinol-phosphate phosphatase family protein
VRDVLEVRASGGRGPAAARNVGWHGTDAEWIAFLDDDVVVGPTWLAELATDLAVPTHVGGVQGRVHVPLPADRRPTDTERGTAGLAEARWITADMAYRRSALVEACGFDERFPGAFREDADLALRVLAAGHSLVLGTRQVQHPVRPAAWHASIGRQRGNADDALMRALHGRDWYARAGADVGRRPWHLVTTSAAAIAALAGLAGRRRTCAAAAAVWLASTLHFAAERIAPGPRTPAEVGAMLATSAVIPPLATLHWLRGTWTHRSAPPWSAASKPVAAVLFDRDGTLIVDVPYNGDPARVRPYPGVADAVRRLRRAGVRVGVVTNQSAVARRLVTAEQVHAVNARVDALLGPFDTWQVCPHGEADGCSCRKPQPGMVHAASVALGVPVERCAVVGDTAADVAAAQAAGALGVLVPNGATRRAEVAAAARVCPTVPAAVAWLLGADR